MMWLKGCPKCGGDLYEEPAIGPIVAVSRYINCLQCGHLLSEQEEALLLAAALEKPKAGRTRVA